LSSSTPIQTPIYDQGALIERLTNGIKRTDQEVVFLVGAPMSSPQSLEALGVPGVDGVLSLVRREFDGDSEQLSAFEIALSCASDRRYQSAFDFLQGRRGQRVANEIVQRAVLAARMDSQKAAAPLSEDACRLLELDPAGWHLNPGTEYLGRLVTAYPKRFGRYILTTNFDPLIEVSIRRAGGHYFRTILHSDGDFTATDGSGCHVIHLHGYWHGSDTLHTARQIENPRPRLRASLSTLLRNKVVVVCAYGGWDDTFTAALLEVLHDDAARPDIIWTLHAEGLDSSNQSLFRRLETGVSRGRVNLYGGIDCHALFQRIFDRWLNLEVPSPPPTNFETNRVKFSADVIAGIQSRTEAESLLQGDDEDRPPLVEICVGRESQLKALESYQGKVIFLTGLGGQGKSTIAARYFAECRKGSRFSYYVWRDCKEEGERFENQLASIIERLSEGKIAGEDLKNQSIEEIVQLLVQQTKNLDVLYVFDNVDHYVNLETRSMLASPDVFIQSLLASNSRSQAVFTCRPRTEYTHLEVLGCHLEGLGIEAATELFRQRSANATSEEIEDAHGLTNGHAFWLDLLAIQVSKRSPEISLSKLVTDLRHGGGPLPDKTLNSIWSTLNDREQKVLRAMAETMKAEREDEIGEYLRHEMPYNKVIKALNTLRALNLVVVKQSESSPDVLELHPLVKKFVQTSFGSSDRVTFIDAIVRVYRRYIGNHKSDLDERPSLTVLQYWTQAAELDISASRFNEAFAILAEVGSAFLSSAYPREFCRVARNLLAACDWVSNYSKYKGFERTFEVHIDLLSYLGEHKEVDHLLEKYEMTVVDRNVRYISYCEMRSHTKWIREDFAAAVTWGRIGRNFKQAATDVDTRANISHTLALAERDSGHPEVALPTFLAGRNLSQVINPEEFDEKRGGAYYGNIGRCLHFMGQIDSALVCYQKSALIIEKDLASQHVLNQGYIRAWIGELLVGKGQIRLAASFYCAAAKKWEHAFPTRAVKVLAMLERIEGQHGSQSISETKAERICLDWILGR
jgi:hypothetical protein